MSVSTGRLVHARLTTIAHGKRSKAIHHSSGALAWNHLRAMYIVFGIIL